MIFINVILAAIFWTMVDEAVNDGRPGWGFLYLFVSAMNGAAVLADIFQECKMEFFKETLVWAIGLVLIVSFFIFAIIYDTTLKAECRENAINQGYAAVEILVICK